jgi:hemerythrin-like metal-binding protein
MARPLNYIDMKVGVTMLDRDHQDMFEAFQEIRDCVVRNQKRNRVDAQMRKLARFNLTHFALEDEMMRATKYPGIVLHRLEHQWLNEQMDTLIALRNQSDFALNEHSIQLLTESHLAHMQQDDLQYGYWLGQNGVR